MDSAGAPTAVVTPPGDTATASGGSAAGLLGTCEVDVDGVADEVGGAGSVADEHPDRNIPACDGGSEGSIVGVPAHAGQSMQHWPP